MLFQPITGALSTRLSSTSYRDSVLSASLGLYAVAGLFCLPVIFMQIEMRISRARPIGSESCRRVISRYFAAGSCSVFQVSVLSWLILWLMIAKPV